MNTVAWGYKNYYKKRMKVAVINQLMGEIAIFIGLITPLLSQLIFDGVVNYREGDEIVCNPMFRWLLNGSFGELGSLKLLVSIASVFIVLILIRCGLIVGRNNWFRRNGVKAENEMRADSYKKLLRMSEKSLEKYNTGDLLTTMESDIICFKELYAWGALALIDLFFMLVVACVFLVYYQVSLILIPLLIAPVLLFVLRRYMKASKTVSSDIRDRNAEMNLFVQENVNGIRLVKSYANEDYARKGFTEKNDRCRDAFFRQVNVQSKYNIVFNTLRQTAYVLTIAVGGYFAIRGDIRIGVLVACTSYVMNIMSYITTLNSYLYTVEQYKVSGDRFRRFMEEEEIPETKNHATFRNFDLSDRHVFLEEDGKEVLHDVNLEIPYGMKLGIMGETGSGKSALLKTLSDIIPDYRGEIFLGCKNIREYDIEDLRSQFSYVFQDVFLFSDTIGANIAFSRPNAAFSEIVAAAKFAQAHKFIRTMTEGYETIVGEKGVGLSGGQKQRISVARALIKNSPILILDDATSALDRTTEHDLLMTIKEKYPHKTLIISAHKVSSVKDCDLIVYLENGRIVEKGTYDELIAKNGIFADVVRLQSSESEEA